MPLLLRSATQAMLRRRQLVPLIFAFYALVMDDELEDACYMFSAVLCGARMLSGASRSWQKGINRVAIWSFDNMYSDTQCWEQLRVRKDDMPRLAAALQLPDVIVTANEAVFGRMEALVTFLHRMAQQGSWEALLPFLGGRRAPASPLMRACLRWSCVQHRTHARSTRRARNAHSALPRFMQACVLLVRAGLAPRTATPSTGCCITSTTLSATVSTISTGGQRTLKYSPTLYITSAPTHPGVWASSTALSDRAVAQGRVKGCCTLGTKKNTVSSFSPLWVQMA